MRLSKAFAVALILLWMSAGVSAQPERDARVEAAVQTTAILECRSPAGITYHAAVVIASDGIRTYVATSGRCETPRAFLSSSPTRAFDASEIFFDSLANAQILVFAQPSLKVAHVSVAPFGQQQSYYAVGFLSQNAKFQTLPKPGSVALMASGTTSFGQSNALLIKAPVGVTGVVYDSVSGDMIGFVDCPALTLGSNPPLTRDDCIIVTNYFLQKAFDGPLRGKVTLGITQGDRAAEASLAALRRFTFAVMQKVPEGKATAYEARGAATILGMTATTTVLVSTIDPKVAPDVLLAIAGQDGSVGKVPVTVLARDDRLGLTYISVPRFEAPTATFARLAPFGVSVLLPSVKPCAWLQTFASVSDCDFEVRSYSIGASSYAGPSFVSLNPPESMRIDGTWSGGAPVIDPANGNVLAIETAGFASLAAPGDVIAQSLSSNNVQITLRRQR
jgi:hypothetical protein